ncbi:putative disease resistance protein RGA4 [Durio zibethinus]|uniref:Disease resistance protein RGA4 n=1 Tax=Durio zibethinus TaxID=66656 RepID=A0A6P5WQ98_DURZI|nr:putative disease resistance protein RGA4 [Durio zibethinus]
MSKRIKNIRKRLDEIAADKSKFNRREIVLGDVRVKNSGRETAPMVRSAIMGRENNIQDIIELLLQEKHNQQEDSNIPIVAIVGLGGLGKTTLAQLVYKETTIEKYFSTRIWVCVSAEFDARVIFKKMLEAVTGGSVGDLALAEIQKQLEENLRGKRYLLVLDDAWNENDFKWENFFKYLVKGALGSKMLVTTRSKNVASIMKVNFPYILEGLNEDQSWVLFEQVAFQGQDNYIDPNHKAIGKDLAKRCKGVPLAIKCLASLMRQKPNEKYWSSAKDNKIWKLLEKNDDVFPVLKLSYIYFTKSFETMFCFCSIFPKDFVISRDMLIQMWRAQGYINENLQDIGDEYFNDLLSRSFFQEAERDRNGNIISCKMHDLIHDLAQLVAGSNFYVAKDKQEISKEVHHVLLECIPSQEFFRHLSTTTRVRTLLCGFHIHKLTNSIDDLKYLRFLELNWCSNLKELPRDIGKLISLEYLDIEGCGKLKCLPKGIGELASLQRLSTFIVNSDEQSFPRGATLNEPSELNSLGGCLYIRNLEKVGNVGLESNEANLKEKKYLQALKLIWERNEDNKKHEQLLDNLEPHPNLKELGVSGYSGARFSRWLSSPFKFSQNSHTR